MRGNSEDTSDVTVPRRRPPRPYNSAVNATWLNRLCLLLSFAGMAVALFLGLSYIMNVTIPCGPAHGCDIVARSPYSKWFDIPVAFFGLGGYIMLAALGIFRAFSGSQPKRRLATIAGLVVSGIGTLVSFYLIFTSLFTIRATCIWCMASAAIMTILFLTHAMLMQAEDNWKNEPKREGMFIGVFAVFALLIIGFRFVDLQKTKYDTGVIDPTRNQKIEDFVPANAHVLGPNKAMVTVIEFGDLTCPHCKESYQHMKQIVKASNGNVRFVFRHFPLITMEGHELALPAAVISELANEKHKFWEFVDAMFAVEDATKLKPNDIDRMVTQLGFSMDEIRARLTNEKDVAYAKVKDDMDAGKKIGISSTPTFLIGLAGHNAIPETASTIQNALEGAKFAPYVKGA
jgi:uncharacterized membrane protein/protein-disulfide isomerase